MSTGTLERMSADVPVRAAPLPLYGRILGPAWPRLGEAVRLAHSSGAVLHGRLRVSSGGPIARAAAWLFRLPRPSESAETRLVVVEDGEIERWVRSFDGRRLVTIQYQGPEHELAERTGPLEFRFRLEAIDDGLVYRQVATCAVLGSIRLELPLVVSPWIDARERPAGPRSIDMHVRISAPLIGPVLIYEGRIDVEGHA